MKQDILNLENKNVGTIELNDAIYGLEVRADILHRVVNWQLARLQSGNHKTKGRSEVALTPAKPFKQKGSGNARQGSRKGTQFRKGGISLKIHNKNSDIDVIEFSIVVDASTEEDNNNSESQLSYDDQNLIAEDSDDE